MGGSAVLEGAGIHTGAPCRLELIRRPLAGGTGIRFSFEGRPGFLAPGDLAQLPRQARRATVLGDGDRPIHTPEHLLAALLFFADSPLDVRLGGPELPNLDGSALPFREALARLFPERAARPSWREYPCALEWEHAWDGGAIRVEPAARLSVEWSLDSGPLRESCRLESAAMAWSGILPARTWIFHRDWIEGKQAGLLRGAGSESGLLLAGSEKEHAALMIDGAAAALLIGGEAGPYPLLNQNAWRMEGEAVRHKVLDLIGDLALLDLSLPSLKIEIRNGGHPINHILLEKLAECR